eukprot:TRINITY_DN18304_c0_g1_i1.p1 TRINITY_DN18304_c0_g1~~TRINITY_DN18304_c0_g1_i1.p1  ORF type:complete len:426 (+),score=102.53 TRINITY_DN18304_c0_g1_i1:83-1360(+)
MAYDASAAKRLRRQDTAGLTEELDLASTRYGVGVSWSAVPGRPEVDIDLQCVVVDSKGVIIDCAYYNNLKAARGITHSGDEVHGKPEGIQELVWASLNRLPESVAVLIFVVAAYAGGKLKDVSNGMLHVLEDTKKKTVGQFEMERSDGSVDVVAAMHKMPDGSWKLRIIDEPARQGQHFMDIMPLLADTIRLFIPSAPRRQKVAFAMEKGGVLDLPQDLASICVGLGWDTDEGEVDLDVSAVLLNERGECLEAVFFGQLESDRHGIKHSGDNLTGAGDGDDEQIMCELGRIGHEVKQVVFVINIYTPRINFKQVANPYCRVLDQSSGSELCRYALRDAGRENGLIIAKIAREVGNRWGFHALGLPCTGRTFKDSLRQIQRAVLTKTSTLMRRGGSGDSLGSAQSYPVPAYDPRVPVANQPCCSVQ